LALRQWNSSPRAISAKMVAFTGLGVKGVKISEAVGRLKTVPPDGNLARTARARGISLGD
jgi:ATP-dependent phosphofructokinase / diphosphate-dependent phosphofructokinase